MSTEEHKDAREQFATPSDDRRSHLWTLLFGAGILLFGMVIGACLTFFFMRSRLMKMIRNPRTRSRAMVRRLNRALDLTDEQRREVRRIIGEHRENFNEIRRQIGPEIRAQMKSLQKDIARVLDEEQKSKWEGYVKRLRETWLKRFQSRGNERRRRGRKRE